MKTQTLSTTVALISAAGPRNFLHIQNNSAQTVYLAYDGDPTPLTTSNGMPLAAGAMLQLGREHNKAVYGIVAATTSDIRVQGES